MFIAYLQVMAIVLVVLYHSFHQYPGGNYGFDIWGMRLLATLRMPIFLFISGFLMVITTERKKPSWGEYSLRKLKRLLIPFFTLTLVTFIPRAKMSSMADDPIELSFSGLADALTRADSMVIPFFWYLQASVILLCGTYLLTLVAKKTGLPPVLLYLAGFFIFLVMRETDAIHTDLFSLNRTFKWGANFFLGAAFAFIPEKTLNRIPWTSPVFTLCSAAIWVTLFTLFERTPYLSELVTISAFITFISIAKILVARKITTLDHLTGANYIIFLLSWFFNVLSQQVLHHFIPALPWMTYTILSLVLGIYCPLAIYNLLKKHKEHPLAKATSFLLGQ